MIIPRAIWTLQKLSFFLNYASYLTFIILFFFFTFFSKLNQFIFSKIEIYSA